MLNFIYFIWGIIFGTIYFLLSSKPFGENNELLNRETRIKYSIVINDTTQPFISQKHQKSTEKLIVDSFSSTKEVFVKRVHNKSNILPLPRSSVPVEPGENDNCYAHALNFHRNDWRVQFNLIQNCYAHRYKGKLPPMNPYRSPLNITSYSRQFVKEENGVVWAFGNNICYNFGSSQLEVFAEPGAMKIYSERIKNFQHRWSFKYLKGEFPENNPLFPVIDGYGNWMIIPGWTRHTSHLAQNAIMINHHLHRMNDMPPVCVVMDYLLKMRRVFMPHFDSENEIKWTKELLRILKMTHPDTGDLSLSIIDINEMKKMAGDKRRLCFRYLTMSGHVGHDGMGGYYPHPYEADTFRAATYKAFNLSPENVYHRSSHQLKLLYLQRDIKSKGRQLLNVEEMEKMISDMTSMYQYDDVAIHTIPMLEQVQITMNSDVIISVHGAAVATIMFLLPNSAYVELRPPNFRDNWYNLLCYQSRLQYVAMNNFSFPLPKECPSIDATLNPPKYQSCWRLVHFSNFYVCTECLRSVLIQLFYSTNLLKYHN